MSLKRKSCFPGNPPPTAASIGGKPKKQKTKVKAIVCNKCYIPGGTLVKIDNDHRSNTGYRHQGKCPKK